MPEYLWQHQLTGEPERLRMMSDVLDPSSRYHLARIGVAEGWRCLEIGAGNGSLSQWLALRVGSTGKVIASDINVDLIKPISAGNLDVRRFDVVKDEPPEAPYDLIVMRALLHHLPERRAVVARLATWLKPGGWVMLEEPDFYPTWTVEPATQRKFWSDFVSWAAAHGIDYYVGRKVAPWLAEEGMADISAEGHTIVHNGGAEFAQWWIAGIAEVAGALQNEAGVSAEVLDEFYALYRDPAYWTMSIAFTATAARRHAKA
jgi:2-polyprenyl-3-methyl-5-hydroxy-6-metoxy-1,4-benzoquinol methylase